ncbi:MAG: hypothetical protein AAFU79_33610, partial [Myxococcota bacterium]
ARAFGARAEKEARALGDRAHAALKDAADTDYGQAASQAGQRATAAGHGAAERIRSSKEWQQLEETARRAAESTRSAASSAGERIEQVRREAEIVLDALDEVAHHAGDRELVLAATARLLERVGPQLDLLADGVVIGTLQEAGAGVAALRGTEILYVPADGPLRAHLRVNRVEGRAARLAIGGQIGAYVGALYAPRQVLLERFLRRGAELGLLLLSIRFFRLESSHEEMPGGCGWLLELSAGVSIGLSDLGAFEIEDTALAQYQLEPEEAAILDAALAQAPDAAARRRVARLLARDAEGKPG